MNIILQGIVGSTAYGLSRKGSDIDRMGIFAHNPRNFYGLESPVETIVETKPDKTLHEVGKFCRLALKCNPAVLEVLWLNEYETKTYWGDRLIEIRKAFLSEDLVRNSYGQYAKQQLVRLQRRQAEGKDGFSSDTKKRTAKHARHIFRLLRQGSELLSTGNITIKLSDPETFWAFDDASVDHIADMFEDGIENFNNTRSILREAPDTDAVERFLFSVRECFAAGLPALFSSS